MTFPRSAIPRVVGVLAIVFAAIGMFWSFTAWTDAQHMARWEDAERVADTIVYREVFFAISIGLFLLHVLGGALLCAYRKLGRTLLLVYAIGAIGLLAVDFYMMFTLPDAGPSHDRHGFGGLVRLFVNVIALPWPIIVLALINTRRAREALR